MNWLNNSPIWRKLTLVVLAMFVPVVVLTYLLISGNNELIAFAKKEKEGNAYGTPLFKFAEEVANWRGMASEHLATGSESSAKMLAAKTESINSRIKEVQPLDQQLGASFKTTKSWADVQEKWGKLAKNVSDRKSSVSECQEQHAQLMGDIVTLFGLVGESSNLLFDPVLESYYLMDVMFYRVPKEMDLLSQIGEKATTVASKKKATSEDKKQILLLIGQHQTYQETIVGDVQSTIKASPAMEKQLRGMTDKYTTAADSLIELVMKEVIAPAEVSVAPDAMRKATEGALTSTAAMYANSTDDLDGLLQGRIDKEAKRNQIAMLSIGVGLIVTLALVAFIIRRITRQIKTIMSTFDGIGMGDFKARAGVFSKDELGDLADSVNVMLDNTIGLIEANREPVGV